jgi:hypothetical protein
MPSIFFLSTFVLRLLNCAQFGDLEVSSTSSSDEPIIELLERERKQWQAERERLIQCIHLQQLELTQRSMAAQERALEIAKVRAFQKLF